MDFRKAVVGASMRALAVPLLVASQFVINLLDVAPFIDTLVMGHFQAEADINFDGVVDLMDVEPFVQLLEGS